MGHMINHVTAHYIIPSNRLLLMLINITRRLKTDPACSDKARSPQLWPCQSRRARAKLRAKGRERARKAREKERRRERE